MGAGMPISGVVGRAEIMDAPPPGTLGGTYSGNPVACAAALAVLDIFERENLAERSREVGRVVHERFVQLQKQYPMIGDVRGQGGMLAMEIVKDRATKEPDAQSVTDILAAAHQRGLILISAGMYGNVVRVLVPLNISDEQLQQGLDILAEAIGTVAGVATAVHSVS
jgi:4-aminobutyrate aminotransferase / (S)-3-amino-2-methylpropionate transaminase / 5-aminovalerate transaminase